MRKRHASQYANFGSLLMIQQIEHKYSEEHIMESTTVNKKNTARTICAIIGGIIVLNLLWWIAILCIR